MLGLPMLWLGCVLLSACAPISDPPPEASSVQTLPPVPRQTEGDISPEQLHRYRLNLEPGDFVRITVQQLGADVVLSLHTAGGETVAEVDDLDGAWGAEELVWQAEQEGSYELRLSPWRPPPVPEPASQEAAPPDADESPFRPPGRYRLSLDGPRAPESDDELRLAAAAALRRGSELERRTSTGKPHPSLVAYAHAAELYGRLGDSFRQSIAHLRLGRGVARQGAMDTALRHYRHSLALLQTASEQNPHQVGQETGKSTTLDPANYRQATHSQRASLLTSMARAYRLTGEPEQALDANLQALGLYREIGDLRGQALALNNLAVVYDNGGELERALEHYESALELWRRVADPGEEANTLHNLGTLYALAGRDTEAEDFLLRALELRRRLGDRRGEAATLTALGWGHHLRGEHQQAVDELRQALALRRAASDRRGEATTLDRLGTVLAARGELSQALAAYGSARDLLEATGDTFGLANTLANLGNLHRQQDRPELAIESYRRALPLLREVGDRHAEASAWANFAQAQRSFGKLDDAWHSAGEALALLEAHHQTTQRPNLRSAFLDVRYPAYELAVDLAMELHDRRPGEGWHLEALRVSERARAQNLLASLRRTPGAGDAALPPDLSQRREQLSATIAELRRPVSPPEKDRDRALREALRDLDQLRGEIRRRNPLQTAFAAPPDLDWQEFRQDFLDDETVLLYFALGEERSFLWWSMDDELHALELPPRRHIEDAARRLHRLLAASHQRTARGQAQIAARELSAMLLDPVAQELGSRRLLVVPDGALHYVPFAALPRPQAPSDEPLLTRHQVIRAPSVSVLAALRTNHAHRTPAPGLLAVVGDPVLGPGDPRWQGTEARSPAAARTLPRLEHAAREAEEILQRVLPDQRLALLGFDANRQQVIGGRLARYRILHFATHALLDAQRPQLSALLLSPAGDDDGLLRAHELYALSLPAELVVLSACHTALGQELRGEGLVGLTDGFLYAGASRVVVSLWPVSDRATAALMRDFYAGLLEQNLPAAEALRRAQLSLRREAAWNSPAFWAGFVVVGDWLPADLQRAAPGNAATAPSQKSQVATHTPEDALDLY
jgi:CHAT domain-containing protein/Tfp pilus assembly protein PilF